MANKVLIVLSGANYGNTGLDLVESALRKQEDLEIVTLSIKKMTDETGKVANELATSKYVIVSKPIGEFCKIQFRSETKEIMLNSVAFMLYDKGKYTNYFLKWQEMYEHLSAENDISVLQIPSENLENRYRRYFSNNDETDCSLRGCCNTDLYFRENAVEDARQKLAELFPEIIGKKILLYMPTVRRRNSCENWLSMLNMEVLKELIGEEYVVVINFNVRQLTDKFYNTVDIQGFSKMLNNELPVRQLMLAADVIVGDYRDTFYESALLHKPVFFTVSDYEKFIKRRNFAWANMYEKFIFGPVINTEQELADQLHQCKTYDYSAMERFREEMLADCDGHSVERVVNYISTNSV